MTERKAGKRRKAGISQREARAWKKRALYAERLADPSTFTPGTQLEVARFTLDDSMVKQLRAAQVFGARCRVERTGALFQVFAYRDEEAPHA